jgi:hypothetical protein
MGYYTIYTKEELLNNYSEQEILSLYNVPLNILMSSPFRKDINPSFKLFTNSYGKIFYKDFSTGEAGDLFSFLERLTNKTFYDVLKDISYKLVSNNSSYFSSNTNKYKQYNTSDVKIQVKKKSFNTYELMYWMQYGIYESDLLRNNIVSCSIVEIYSNDFKYRLVSTLDNPIFGYSWYDGKELKWKIYSPLAEKQYKWKNNIPAKAVFWFIINDTKELIITKSVKDCLVLNNLGYNAMTGSSESIVFNEPFINNVVNRFDNVYLLYDFDLTGVSTVNKIRKINPKLKYFFTGKKSYNKDVSDTYENLGYFQSKQLIDEKVFSFRKFPNSCPN